MRINLLFVCLKTPISESSVLMFVEHNLIKNIKIFTLAFTLTVVLIQLSRLISPLAVIHSNYIFWRGCTVRNAVNLVYLWLAWCRSHFMWDVLHQSVEPSSHFFTDRVMIGSQRLQSCVPVQYYAGNWGRVGVMD